MKLHTLYISVVATLAVSLLGSCKKDRTPRLETSSLLTLPLSVRSAVTPTVGLSQEDKPNSINEDKDLFEDQVSSFQVVSNSEANAKILASNAYSTSGANAWATNAGANNTNYASFQLFTPERPVVFIANTSLINSAVIDNLKDPTNAAASIPASDTNLSHPFPMASTIDKYQSLVTKKNSSDDFQLLNGGVVLDKILLTRMVARVDVQIKSKDDLSDDDTKGNNGLAGVKVVKIEFENVPKKMFFLSGAGTAQSADDYKADFFEEKDLPTNLVKKNNADDGSDLMETKGGYDATGPWKTNIYSFYLPENIIPSSITDTDKSPYFTKIKIYLRKKAKSGVTGPWQSPGKDGSAEAPSNPSRDSWEYYAGDAKYFMKVFTLDVSNAAAPGNTNAGNVLRNHIYQLLITVNDFKFKGDNLDVTYNRADWVDKTIDYPDYI